MINVGYGLDLCLRRIQLIRMLAQVDRNRCHLQFGAEAGGLHFMFSISSGPECPAASQEILDQRGYGELASGLVAFEDERLRLARPRKSAVRPEQPEPKITVSRVELWS